MDCRNDAERAAERNAPPTLLIRLDDCDLDLQDLGFLLRIAKKQGNRPGCRQIHEVMGLLTWADDAAAVVRDLQAM